jgi:DNA-binding GntR family transcriptional regulator
LITRTLLVDEVYEALKGLILDSGLGPGERLNIETLSAQLGVSQTPIREGLARLQGDRLAVKRPKGGYAVAPMLNAEAFNKLFEVRIALEPGAAARAAGLADAPALREMENAVMGLSQSQRGRRYSEYGNFAALDFAFHARIAAASGNEFLEDAIVRLRVHQQVARLYHRHGVVDADLTIAEHLEIMAALRARDGKHAETLMRAHIDSARRRLLLLLDKEHADRVEAEDGARRRRESSARAPVS